MPKRVKKPAQSNLPDDVLAALFGIAAPEIAKIRDGLKRRQGVKPKFIRYQDVDWSKSDAKIGAEVGRSFSAVKAIREALGKKRYRPPNRPPANFEGVDWSQSNKAIAEKHGIRYMAVLSRRRYHKLPPNPPRFPATGFIEHAAAGHVNWDMPDSDIADAYRMSRSGVHGARKVLKKGFSKMPRMRNSPERKQAMAAQKKIADAWYAAKSKKPRPAQSK